MTEAEWLTCTDPRPMLEFLRGKGNRKLRLFACACWRYIGPASMGDQIARVVEIAERHADGLAGTEELQREYRDFDASNKSGLNASVEQSAFNAAKYATDAVSISARVNTFKNAECRIAGGTAHHDLAVDKAASRAFGVARAAMCQSLCDFLRDIFGNPFRSVLLGSSSRTLGVVALAQAAYQNRSLSDGTLDPTGLAILADALEDVGCDDSDILNHLRGPGPHARGCWVVDLLLGRQ